MKKFLHKFGLLLGVVLIAFDLGACSKKNSSSSQKKLTKINVVATTNFYGQIAKEVLGDHGKVTSIIDSPNVDPHDFTPTTATAKTVSKANLVIYNGVGYDSWVKKLNAKKYLSVGKVVKAKDGDNEHLWYNPKNMELLVDALVKQYSSMLPQYKEEFKKNASAYKKKLNTLTAKIDEIKKLKHNNNVAVSEPVFNYALQAMGFNITDEHFAMAIEEGSDPSYTDIRDLQNSIKNHKIAFFVFNKQSDSKVVDNLVDLCKKENVPVVEVTETMPANDSYIEWFSQELNQVLKIVKQEA